MCGCVADDQAHRTPFTDQPKSKLKISIRLNHKSTHRVFWEYALPIHLCLWAPKSFPNHPVPSCTYSPNKNVC